MRHISDNPLISVVIPTYNRADFLRGALASVVEQDYRPIEVIVVDDGSDVAYAAGACAAFGSEIIVFRQPNSGLSAARNAGIRRSRGELVALLDDDDFWMPGKLRRQVDLLRRTGAVLAYCGAIYLSQDGSTSPGILRCPREISLHDVIRGAWAPSPSMLFVRETAMVAGLFTVGRLQEDVDFLSRMSVKGRLVGLNEPLVGVRNHRGPRLCVAAGTLDASREQARVSASLHGDCRACRRALAWRLGEIRYCEECSESASAWRDGRKIAAACTRLAAAGRFPVRTASGVCSRLVGTALASVGLRGR